MNASRRLVAFVIALTISSVSCDALPFTKEAPQASLSDSATARTREVLAVRRVLERFPTALQPDELSRLAKAVVVESERAAIPVELVLGVIAVESSGYNFAVSHVGAIGLMQLMPTTAEAVAEQVGVRWYGAQILFDPVVNVRLGVEYLRGLIDRYGSVDAALAAYNWGPSRISEWVRRGKAIPAGYADKVLHASEIAKTAIL